MLSTGNADLLGQSDENALGTSDVAEPIHVFVPNHFVAFRWLEPQLGEKRDRGVKRLHDDADVVHSLNRHGVLEREAGRRHPNGGLDNLDEKAELAAGVEVRGRASPAAPKEWIRAITGCPAASISTVT